MQKYSLDILADYLDCSADYLLGRTDAPNAVNSCGSKLSNDEKELLTAFNVLSDKEKGILLGYARRMAEERTSGIKENIS